MKNLYWISINWPPAISVLKTDLDSLGVRRRTTALIRLKSTWQGGPNLGPQLPSSILASLIPIHNSVFCKLGITHFSTWSRLSSLQRNPPWSSLWLASQASGQASSFLSSYLRAKLRCFRVPPKPSSKLLSLLLRPKHSTIDQNLTSKLQCFQLLPPRLLPPATVSKESSSADIMFCMQFWFSLSC